jgi:hypothetical protein
MQTNSGSRGAAVVVGLLLIVGGVLLLAVQWYGLTLPFDLGQIGWPVYVIAPGAALLLIGLASPAGAGVGLSVAGGIVTTIGLLLAYQAGTGHWASWAYAWALVAPTSVGASMLLWAILHWQRDIARSGLAAMGVGLAIFIVGFAFFEGVLGIGGQNGLAPLGRQLLPVALIGAGVLLILTRLWPTPRRGGWDAAPPLHDDRPPAAPAGVPSAPVAPPRHDAEHATPERVDEPGH